MRECGIVLAGGGGRGAYQIGCWLALKEAGFVATSVAGLSVGGLNAALIGQDDTEAAIAVWMQTTNRKVYRWDAAHWARAPWEGMRSLVHHTRAEWNTRSRGRSLHRPVLRALAHTMYRRGLFNTRHGLHETIERYLHPERLVRSRTRIWIALVAAHGWLPWRGETQVLDLKSLPLDQMRAVLLAAASPPVLFPAVRSGHRWLSDAGWNSGLPVEPVYRDGARLIFALHLHPNQRADAAQYPGARIIDLCPSRGIGAMLIFSPARSAGNLELGRRDTRAALARLAF